MASHEIEDQAVASAEYEYSESASEGPIPDTKSGVGINPNAAMQSARCKKGDIVHSSHVSGGRRIKLTGEIYKSRYNSQGGYVEHQLRDVLDRSLKNNGAWFRDGDLRLERVAQR